MPRRTRSSTQTTALQPPIKRTAPTEETPTLALAPVEIDSLVHGTAASAREADFDDADTRTVENVRLALGSSSMSAAAVTGTAVEPAGAAVTGGLPGDGDAVTPADFAQPAPDPASTASSAASRFPAPAPASTASSAASRFPAPAPPTPARGPRRTRETLRADAIKPPVPPPTRKR